MDSVDTDFEWYSKAKLEKYSGEWVAIVDQKVVAHDRSEKQVFEKARKEYPGSDPLLARVLPKEVLIV